MTPGHMSPLILDRIRSVLPDLDDLRPFWRRLAERSAPDPERTWSGSGHLGTLGSRIVDVAGVDEVAGELAAAEAERLGRLYATVARVLRRVEADDPVGAARALLDAAAMEEGGERMDRAEAFAVSAYDLVRDLRDQTTASLALRRAARAARALGRLGDAEGRYREAHRLARDSFEHRGAAEAAVGLGNVLLEEGAWAEAETWYRRSLEALDEVEGPTSERWHAMLNIHITLRSRGRLEESVEWLERAEEEADRVGDPDGEVYLENARGQLEMAAGRFDAAEEHLRRAASAAEAAGPDVVIRTNLAEALLAQDRVLEATEEAREAERRAVTDGVFPRLPEVYRLLGRIAAQDGNPEAFVFFERALKLVEEHGLPGLEAAVTLQAYGAMERSRGHEEIAEELEARARERYRDLGIEEPRRPWSDTFGQIEREGDVDGAAGSAEREREIDG